MGTGPCLQSLEANYLEIALDLEKYLYSVSHDDVRPYHIQDFRESLEYIISQTDTLLLLSADENAGGYIKDILILHHHRFHHLELHGINIDQFYSFIHRSPALFSNLETLFVSLQPEPATRWAPFRFQIAPNLRKLCCRYISRPPSRIQLSSLPPFTQLAEISIRDIRLSSSAVHATLQHCPGLQVVSCLVLLTADKIIPNNGWVTLPSLKTLKVGTRDIIDWDSFLHQFVFPALTHLDFCATESLGPLQPFS